MHMHTHTCGSSEKAFRILPQKVMPLRTRALLSIAYLVESSTISDRSSLSKAAAAAAAATATATKAARSGKMRGLLQQLSDDGKDTWMTDCAVSGLEYHCSDSNAQASCEPVGGLTAAVLEQFARRVLLLLP